MMSTYVGQSQKLGDLPLIVLSRKNDAQEIYEQNHPMLPQSFTMEVAQQLANNLNDMQDELAALSSRGKHIVVEDTGHFIQLDQPQVVIDAIREVFVQVARPGDIQD
jgi:pimeloyl-ACP methyl ester carboxylesterase